MPLIRLEYDDKKVSDTDIEQLSQDVRDIISMLLKLKMFLCMQILHA